MKDQIKSKRNIKMHFSDKFFGYIDTYRYI